jgi:sugar phosphate isomerase/epimerase
MFEAMMLSLAAGCVLDTRGPRTIEVAASGGWQAAGIWYEPDEWRDGTMLTETRSALASTGLPVLDIEVLRIQPGEFRDEWRSIIDTGAAIGARNLLCISLDPDMGATAAHFARICELAAEADIRACIEFMAFTAVRELGDALALVERVDHPAAGVLVDALHLARTGGHPRDLVGIDPRLLPYAQWCDGLADGPCIDDTRALITDALDARSCPGEGGLPVGEFVWSLPAATPLSLEIRSQAYRSNYPDPGERSAALYRATAGYLRRSR